MVLAFALMVRLLAIVAWGLVHGFSPKVWEYEDLATELINGNGYRLFVLETTYRAFGRPLYPLLTAGVYAMTSHNQLAMLLVQAVVSAATAVLALWAGNLLYDWRSGLAAGVLVSLHPGLVFMATTELHYVTLDAFILIFLWLQFWRAWRYLGIKNEVMCGVLLGAGLLAVPVGLLFIPAASLFLLTRHEVKWSGFLRLNAIVLGVAVLVTVPWNVRNYLVFGRFVFVSDTVNQVLWIGNNPMSSGGTLSRDGRMIIEAQPPEFRQKLYSLDEIGQNEFFRQQALDYIREDPARFVRATLAKFFYFWWFPPTAGTFYPSGWLELYRAYYLGVLALLATGLYAAFWKPGTPQMRRGTQLLWIYLLSVAFFHSFFYVDGHLRWEVEALLLVVAARGLVFILERAPLPRAVALIRRPA